MKDWLIDRSPDIAALLALAIILLIAAGMAEGRA